MSDMDRAIRIDQKAELWYAIAQQHEAHGRHVLAATVRRYAIAMRETADRIMEAT